MLISEIFPFASNDNLFDLGAPKYAFVSKDLNFTNEALDVNTENVKVIDLDIFNYESYPNDTGLGR